MIRFSGATFFIHEKHPLGHTSLPRTHGNRQIFRFYRRDVRSSGIFSVSDIQQSHLPWGVLKTGLGRENTLDESNEENMIVLQVA